MRRMPDWVKNVVREVCARHGVSVQDIMGPSKARVESTARREAIYLVKFEKPSVSSGQLGHWFDRDHSTIRCALARFEELHGAPILSMRTQDRNAA